MIKAVVDEDGYLYSADDLEAPQKGKCGLCGAMMYRTHRSDKYFYALMPGQRHTYVECRTLDQQKMLMDMGSVCMDNLWKRILHMPGAVYPDAHRSTAVGSRESSGPRDLTISKVVTLKRLHVQGLLDCADKLLERGDLLSDLTINPRFAYRILSEDVIGKRILRGKPMACFEKTNAIRLKIHIATDANGERIDRYVTADLQFANRDVYNEAKKMLFRQVAGKNPGEIKLVRKVDRCVVLADWGVLNSNGCKDRCNWTCTYNGWSCAGYLRAEVTNLAQIYPAVATPVKN